MLKNLDFQALTVLDSLLDTCSVSRTAEQLGMSQAATSRALKNLRDTFDDPLFINTGRGLTATPRAHGLRVAVQQSLALGRAMLDGIQDDARTIRRTRFRVATTDFGVISVILPALNRILSENKGVFIDIAPLNGNNLDELASGRLDLVITGFQPDAIRCHSQFLWEDGYECVVRKDHPLAIRPQSTPIGVQDMQPYRHVSASVTEMDADEAGKRLAALGQSRDTAIRIPYFSAMADVVATSDTIAVVPTIAARYFAATRGLVRLPTSFHLGSFGYWVCWHERQRHDASIAWLVDTFANPSPSVPGGPARATGFHSQQRTGGR